MMTMRPWGTVLPITALVLAASLYGVWTPDLDRAELQRRYGAPTQHVLVVDGLRVHYQASGPPDAPAVLLLHGGQAAGDLGKGLVPARGDEAAVALDQGGAQAVRVFVQVFDLVGDDVLGNFRLQLSLLDTAVGDDFFNLSVQLSPEGECLPPPFLSDSSSSRSSLR